MKTSMVKHENGQDIPTGFYMYPRSSISKTKVHRQIVWELLILDIGCLGGYFDVVHTQTNETIQRFHRLVQICSPTLEPFNVVIKVIQRCLVLHLVEQAGLVLLV